MKVTILMIHLLTGSSISPLGDIVYWMPMKEQHCKVYAEAYNKDPVLAPPRNKSWAVCETIKAVEVDK